MPDTVYRALIVDDDAIARRTLIWALVNEKFECVPATDGSDALDKLKTTRFDLVVTDLKMPKMHGHALITELLAGEAGYKPLIVAHTCLDDPKISKDLMLRGIDDMVAKPTNYAVFAAKLKGRVICHRSKMEALNALPDSYSADETEELTGFGPSKHRDIGTLSEGQFDSRLNEVKHILPICDGYRRVMSMVSTDDCDINSLNQFVALDGGMLIEVLRMANSGAYSKNAKPISDLKEAVERLGIKKVADVAGVMSSLSNLVGLVLPWIDRDVAYKRSVAGRAAAKRILELNPNTVDSAAIVNSALLYPYCRVILGSAYCHSYERLIKSSIELKTPLATLEREVFPRSPTESAVKLFQNWQVPSKMYQPLIYADATFDSFTVLRETKRTTAVLLKSAVILGELAVGKWAPWESKSEFPSYAFLQPYNLGSVESMIDDVRNDISMLN